MRLITFENRFECVDELTPADLGHRSPRETGAVIAQEPMVHSADIEFARANGGPLTRAVLAAITRREGWADEVISHESRRYWPVIDTKSVLLMEGQYAAIPGWHCDGVPRGAIGQPILDQIPLPITHYTYVLNDAEATGTEFAAGRVELEVDPRAVWSSVDAGLDALGRGRFAALNGSVVRFSRSSLHRVAPAATRQWRYFFRLSFYDRPPNNLLRRQVNVYTDLNRGW